MELKAIKITDPTWIGAIGPEIQKFCERVNIEGLDYRALYSYFVESIGRGYIQKMTYGAEAEEFHVVFEEKKPIAFAHWYKRSIPFVGVVSCDYIYSWGFNKQAVKMLLDELVQFSLKHRSPIIQCDFINTRVFNHFKKLGNKLGYTIKETGLINTVSMKENRK